MDKLTQINSAASSVSSKGTGTPPAEFAKVMAFITGGCGKSLTDAQTEVYFAMLADLPQKALMIAAQRALLQPLYSAFPTIELLRRLAVDSMAGPEVRMTAGEAWGLALKACGACDIEIPGSVERHLGKLPELVRVAISRFGFRSLYDIPPGSMETARAQFIRIYEGLVAQEKERILLTPAIRKGVDELDERQTIPLRPALTKILAEIGKDGGS